MSEGPNAARMAALQAALGDRYRVLGRIGVGGMAEVFDAADLRHQRRVAVKVLRADLGASMGAERFLREIETAARLSHPHILPIFDSGSAADLLYYVMPLMEGETLGTRLARERRLPVEEALRLVREVALALAYAHGQGVVHRDMKPDNVLLQAGQTLVADFGIATAIGDSGSLTGVGFSVGTPDYMSPEQALGDPSVDGRTDIYALGTMLFEMVAGQRPYAAASPQALLARKVTVDAPPLTSVAPDLPETLGRVVQRALAREPDQRYHDAAAFADALTLVEMNLLTEVVRQAVLTPSAPQPSLPRPLADDAAAAPSGRARHGTGVAVAALTGIATGATFHALQQGLAMFGVAPPVGMVVAAVVAGVAWWGVTRRR